MKKKNIGTNQSQSRGEPWKVINGKCRAMTVYKWKSNKRTVYSVRGTGDPRPLLTTTNEKKAVDMATALSDVAANLAPTLVSVPADELGRTAKVIVTLDPILEPLGISMIAGVEEYARVKARVGKLNLDEFFEGLLASLPDAKADAALAATLREIASAIAKLAPVLNPLNISIASGIEEYAAVKIKAGVQDLRKLFAEVVNLPWVKKSLTPIGKVAQEYVDALKDESGVSSEYHKTSYYTIGAAVRGVGENTPIGAVTTDQLKPIVFSKKRKARSNKTVRNNLRTFMKWCQLHQYLDYAQPTAADRLPKIIVKPSKPRIFTVAEAKATLSALEEVWCLLYLVLSLFTAIRHDELQRLTFDMIKENVLDIPADISKTGKRRLIPLQPCLQAWLAPFRGRTGLVIPIADIQFKTRQFLEKTKAAGVPTKWARNWCRQSYCSYRLAQTRDVIDTAQEDGHRAYVLESVYLEMSTAAEADGFFSLDPAACGKPNWFDQVTAFLKNVPEITVRRKLTRKPWKKIWSGDKAPATNDVTSDK